MRVYSRAMGGTSWSSVEDYLPAGNALGYGTRWQLELDIHYVLMAGSDTLLQMIVAYEDSFGMALRPAMVPCAEQVATPAAEQPCPPLGSGDGCEEGALQLVAYAILPCGSPPDPNRDCNPKESSRCKRFCENLGGFYVGCYYENGELICRCGFPPDKPCNASEVAGCKSACKRQGKRYAGCIVKQGVVTCLCR
ncbi:hypothetical protein HRbin15_02602 [bacterium HR15]|nr:hypothetical protein HRbin15_02602 [bacterium HR15]